jgi:hypothetical protein
VYKKINIKTIAPGSRKGVGVMRIVRLSLWLILAVCCLGGCAGREGLGPGTSLKIGQTGSDLVAQKGEPQEVLPGPAGGKIYVYRRYKLDQMAVMGGGVWGKPQEVYYQLDSHGVIAKINYYPYGKRKFLFPSGEKEATGPQIAALPGKETTPGAPAALPPSAEEAKPPKAAPSAPAAPVAPSRPPAALPPAAKVAKHPKAAPSAPAATPPAQKQVSPPPSPPQQVATASRPSAPPEAALPDMEAATRLELNMTKEEVRRLLGIPERTEGFRVGGKGVITWFYNLRNRQGRQVSTPLVFKDGRLSGWGASYYLRLREVSDQKP